MKWYVLQGCVIGVNPFDDVTKQQFQLNVRAAKIKDMYVLVW